MYRFIFLGFLAFPGSNAFGDEIWLPSTREQIDLGGFEEIVRGSEVLVLGETHYDPEIVAVEASVLRIASEKEAVTFGWEFLNLVDQKLVETTSRDMKSDEISAKEGLEKFFPNGTAVEYTALFEAVAQSRTKLIATNLTRAQKSPVTKNGIDAAEPGIVPPGFQMGSAAYFERFKVAMGPHPLPSPIENYFASQSLTDDVMAYTLAADSNSRKILVTGSFHGDYRDAAVARLEARLPGANVKYIKIVQKSDFAPEALEALMNDPLYGPIADVLYLVDRSSEAKR